MASRLTIKRFDPWSVLKFGAVANLAMLAIFMLMAGVVWFIIDRLALVDQACSIAADVGFTACGIDAGNLFQALALLGLLGVVVMTAVWVFFAFLHNLIADLTGGLVVTVIDQPSGRRDAARRVTTATTAPATTSRPVNQAPRQQPVHQPQQPVHQPQQPARHPQQQPGQQSQPRPAEPTRPRTETDDGSLFGSRH